MLDIFKKQSTILIIKRRHEYFVHTPHLEFEKRNNYNIMSLVFVLHALLSISLNIYF